MNCFVAAQSNVAGLLLDDVIQCQVPVTSQTVALPRYLAGFSTCSSEADHRTDDNITWFTLSAKRIRTIFVYAVNLANYNGNHKTSVI